MSPRWTSIPVTMWQRKLSCVEIEIEASIVLLPFFRCRFLILFVSSVPSELELVRSPLTLKKKTNQKTKQNKTKNKSCLFSLKLGVYFNVSKRINGGPGHSGKKIT